MGYCLRSCCERLVLESVLEAWGSYWSDKGVWEGRSDLPKSLLITSKIRVKKKQVIPNK